MRSYLDVAKFWFFSSLVFFLATGSALSQSTAVNNSPPATFDAGYAVQYIRHETDAQNSILIPLSPALPGSVSCIGAAACNTAGWTVTVGGSPVSVSSVAGVAGTSSAIVNLASAIGIGQAVSVSYGGSANLNAFTNRTSFNARFIKCADFGFSAFIDHSTTCAPVTPMSQMVFTVVAGARNSSRWDVTKAAARVSWITAGAAPQTFLQGKETDIGGNTGSNTYFVGFSSTDFTTPSTGQFTYPNTPGVCGYTSNWNVHLQYGSGNGDNGDCVITATAQTQSYASYNNDNVLPGTLTLPPAIVNTEKVCIGTNANMNFVDATLLNCNPAVAPAPANDKERWVRAVYGAVDYGPGAVSTANIPNVFVGGVQVTDASGNLLFPGGYIPNTGTVLGGTPDGFGVVHVPNPVNSPRGALLPITTSSPTGQAIGQRFTVRLDYWNACNAYDDAGDLLNNNKVSVSNNVIIVTIPTAPTASAPTKVCNGVTPSPFSISGATPSSTVKWYANVSAATPKTVGTVGTLITTTTADGSGNASLPVTTAFPSFVATNADNYIVWASYSASPGGIACESPAVAITRSVLEALSPTGISIKNPAAACPGSTVTFVMEKPAGTPFDISTPKPVGGATEIIWTVPAAVGTLQTGQGTNTITVQLASSLGSGALSANWRFVGTPICLTTITGGTYNMLSPPTVASSTGNRTICEGATTTFGVTAGGSGPFTFRWQADTGSGFADIFDGGVYSNTGTATLTITGALATMTGTKYHCVITGACTPTATSPTRTLTVNPLPSITASPTNFSMCIGGTHTFSVTATGTAPLTFNWQVDASGTGAGAFANITNGGVYSGQGTTNLTITAAPASFNNYRFQVIVNGACPGAKTSTPATLSLQGPTTTTTFSTASVCVATNLNLIASETFLNTAFGSRIWTGTYDDIPLGTAVPLSAAEINALLGGASTSLTPTFNSSGLGVNKVGKYVLTLTTTDNSGSNCTSAATVTINVGQIDANILYGSTSGTRTQTDLAAKVCSGYDVFLDGNPSGGSGSFTGHTWTIVSEPLGAPAIGVLLDNPASQKPVFNTTFAGTYKLRYAVSDVSSSCNFTTGTLPKDITITVNPLPAAADQTPTVCSDPATPTQAIIDLNTNNNSINPSPGVTMTWFTGYTPATKTFTGAIATPTTFTVSAGTVVFAQVTDNTTGCWSPARVTYSLNQRPNLAPSQAKTICSGEQVNYEILLSPLNSPAGTVFNWSAPTMSDASSQGTAGVNVPMGAAGTMHITNVLVNKTGSPIQALYKITPSNSFCTGVQTTVTITVNPEPVVVAGQTKIICSGDAVNKEVLLAPLNAPAGTKFSWNQPVMSDGSSQGTAGSNVAMGTAGTLHITDVLTNKTGAQITATYTINSVSGANCAGVPVDIKIFVNPEPVIVAGQTKTICSGDAVNLEILLNPLNAPAGTEFTWALPTMSGGLAQGTARTNVPMGAAGTFHITDVLTNTTGSQISATYKVQVKTNPGGCVGTQTDVVILVDPAPVLVLNQKKTICSGEAADYRILLTPNNLPAGTTFTWPAPNLSDGSVQGSGGTAVQATDALHITDVLTNSTSAPITATYTITPKSGTNCPGLNQTVVITINPLPVSNPVSGQSVVCTGTDIILYQVTPHAGSTYTWTVDPLFQVFGGGGTNDFFVLLKFSTVGSGNISVVETNSFPGKNCPGAPNTFPITVVPPPAALSIDGLNPVCKGQTNVTFEIPVALFHPSSTYTWTVSGGTISSASTGVGLRQITLDFGLLSTGSIQVTETSISGCAGAPAIKTITIDDRPAMTSLSAGQTCSGSSPSLVLTSSLPSTFHWQVISISGIVGGTTVGNSGDITVGPFALPEVLTNTSGINGVVVYRVTPIGNCAGNPQDVSITVLPEPVLNLNPKTLCSDEPAGYEIKLSPVNIPAGTTFTWSTAIMSDGSSQGSGAITIPMGAAGTVHINDAFVNTSLGSITATYVIDATSGAGCNSHQPPAGRTVVLTINPKPVGGIDLKPVCSNTAVNYDIANNITTKGNNLVAGTTYTWVAVNNASVTGESLVSQSGAFITDVLRNLTPSDQNVIYRVTPKSALNCAGNQFNVTIRVQPEPIVANNLDVTQCSDIAYGIDLNTDGASVAASSYNIMAVVAAGLTGTATTGTPSLANAIRNDKFTNKTSTALTVTYTVIPTGVNTCVGSSKLVVFTVNPEPVLVPQVIPDICSNNNEHGSTTNIVVGTDGTSINAASYRLNLVEYKYSTDIAFSGALPGGFTADGTNQAIGNVQNNSNIVKNDKFTNVSDKSVDVKYTIVPISPAPQGCRGDAADFTITVKPQPTLNHLLSPAPVCSDAITNITLSVEPGPPASIAAADYTIASIALSSSVSPGPGNTGIGTHKAAGAIMNDIYTNTTLSPGTVTYQVAPVSAGGCIGLTAPVILNVNPAPDLLVPPTLACTDATTGLVLAGSPSAVTPVAFDVLLISVDAGLIANPGNATTQNNVLAGYLSGDKFRNPGDVTHKVSYTVKPISAASCKGPTEVVVVTIEPTVKVNPSVAQSNLCGDGRVATSVQLNSPTVPSAGAITFNYTVGALPQIAGYVPVASSLPVGYTIADKVVSNLNVVGTITYNITPVAAGADGGAGCQGTVVPVVISLEPKPGLNVPPPQTICEGTAVAIDLNSPTNSSVGNSGVYFDMTTSISGHPTGYTPNGRFTNHSHINDVLGNTDAGNSSVTYTFTPKFDAAAGTCVGSDVTTVITISHKPKFTSSIANFAICSGESFAPFDIRTDTETAMPGSTVVKWIATATPDVSGESNGAGSAFSQVLFNTKDNKHFVTYTFTATNVSSSPACVSAPLPLTVTVYPNPKVVGLPSSVNVCNNGTLSPNPYPLQASTVGALGTTFNWTVDNGGIGDLPSLPNAANQTQISQIFVNNGSFLGTQQYTITAHLTIPNADNPISDPGLGIDNVCSAQTDATMVVNVAPQVDGNIYGFDLNSDPAANLYLCRGSKQFLYIDPTGLPLMTIDYEENGTPKQITKVGGLNVLQVSPSTTTIYKLTKVTDKFGCSISPNKIVTVNVDEVDNNFSLVGPDINCSPFPVTFQHNQVAGTSYTWKWLDGPDSTTYKAATSVTGKQVRHTYVNPSPGSTMKFRASLDAFLDTTKYLAGCRKRPVIVEVKVYPTVAPAVFADRDVICSNDEVSFTNSTQGASGHRWFYRVQGSTTELDVKTTSVVNFKIPNTSISNPLVYEVVYQSTNGHCPAQDVVTPITVYRGVDAHFSHTTPTLYTGGHSNVSITNDSAPVDGAAFRYDWSFGLNATPETASSVGPTFTIDYITPGSKELTLTATNIAAQAVGLTCFGEYKDTIVIGIPPLIADFIVVPLQACFPTDIRVTENNATGDKFAWRVLDAGGTAAQSNADLPVFKIPAPGKYTVELITTNSFTGDQKSATKDVIIYDLPMASFDFRPGLVYVPDTEMQTYNFSEGATAYTWDFGDGTTSDEREPTHVYKVEGVYDILLIARNDHGGGVVCVDTLDRKITAKQGGVTRIPNAFTPSPNGPSTSTGSNPAANSFNDVFLPQVKGAEEFNMQIFDRWGNLVFESRNSNVGWDGYDKHGKLMPAGVYVYKLTLRLSDDQRTTQVGDVTMIR